MSITIEEIEEMLIRNVDAGRIVAKLDGKTLSPAEHAALIDAESSPERDRICYAVPS